VYALGLVFTHDLVLLVWLRAFAVTLCTSAAIYWLARSCRTLQPLCGLLALLSPYLWFYSRSLWDNSFLIPSSALAVAAYVSFCARPARWKLGIVFASAVSMLLTHLMCLPVLGALAVHLAVRHRAWLALHFRSTCAMLGLGALISAPYLLYLATHYRPDASRGDGVMPSLLFPLCGGRVLSWLGVGYIFGPEWASAGGPLPAGLVAIGTALSAVAFPLSWLGVGLAVAHLIADGRTERDRGVESDLFALLVLTLALQVALSLATQRTAHPHYYNGIWFVFFVLIWIALSRLRSVGLAIAGGLGAVQSLLLLQLITSIHHTQGNQWVHYGPALRTQIALLAELGRFDPRSKLVNESSHYHRFPHAFSVLLQFYPVRPQPNARLADLRIRFERSDPRFGALVLQEQHASPAPGR